MSRYECDRCGERLDDDAYERDGSWYCENCWWDVIEQELSLDILSEEDRKDFLDWKYDEDDTYDLKEREFESEKEDLKTACLKAYCKDQYFIRDMQDKI